MLLGVFAAIALIEAIVRPELSWRSPALIVGLALMPTLLWRRSMPLQMVSIAFGTTAVLDVVRLLTDSELSKLNAIGFVLFLSYSLFRWGSGREVLLGLPLILISASLGFLSEQAGGSEVLGGSAILMTSMALGTAARNRSRAQTREFEQIKLRERARLARDLHDTVAHHVSAIAIRAQAGLATAPAHPQAATDALRVIEAEASSTLAEMRSMVRVLRREEPADLAPTPRITDLEHLYDSSVDGPAIDVDFSGDLNDVSAPVSAAMYRLAQESITNARRHARQATRIEIRVSADDATVRLSVSDDGELAPARSPAPAGYGLIGMGERAELLGGTCHAGPNPERGWTVVAVLPRHEATP